MTSVTELRVLPRGPPSGGLLNASVVRYGTPLPAAETPPKWASLTTPVGSGAAARRVPRLGSAWEVLGEYIQVGRVYA